MLARLVSIAALPLILACGNAPRADLGETAAADSVVHFGAIVSKNGVASSYGRDNERGLRIAEAYINENGGIRGRQVQIRIEDSNSDPEQAINLAATFASNPEFVGVLGPTRTNEAVAVSRLLPQLRIPTISVGSTGPWEEAAKADFGAYMFRSTRVDNPRMIKALLSVARDSFEVTKVAILSLTDDDWSKATTELYKRLIPELGMTIVADQTASAKDDDWSVQLTSIRAASPDAIVVNVLADKAPSVARQARARGIDARFLGTAAFTNPSTWPNAGLGGLDGTLIAENFFAGSARPIVREFTERYKAAYGEDPPSYAAYAFDGALLLAEAARRAQDPTDRDQVREQLGQIRDFEGLLGKITYHGRGDADKDVVLLEMRGGAFSEIGTR